jgi:hypothetical protein
MGLLTNIIIFGKNRSGKIVTFLLVGMGVFFLSVGVIFSFINPSVVLPKSITLVASGMEYKTVNTPDGEFEGYHLSVTQLETAITVKTEPFKTTASVHFKNNSPDFIEVTEKISSKGTAVIKLKKVTKDDFPNGIYEFHPSDTLVDVNKITIDVICGNLIAKIFVRIILTDENTRLSAHVDKINTNTNQWLPTEIVSISDFWTPYGTKISNPDYYYCLNLRFYIFGELIYSFWHNSFSDHDKFGFEDLNPYGSSGIYILGTTLTVNENTESYSPYIALPAIYTDSTFNFKIWCEFNGKYFFTDTDFPLIIELWTE